ncbi:hypothetical protein KPH14_003952 [Odynerus spinipes]|uniref:Uncharacterized protein n=1 Tax=Odynerus spinipes TaxID=1348599 RepID=A0AAD9VVV3_9HYME|nr:hypothetical protein KPH14_003952 [Odynerus spinipes]
MQNVDQDVPQRYRARSHACDGARCVCQRYENGELAVVVMNQNRNQEREEAGYQNAGRAIRNFANRPAGGGAAQVHPNLNPNYQNPVDIVRNYNRARQHQEPEENIYERLDDDDDDEDMENENEQNAEGGRNDVANNRNNQNPTGDHIYERIDDRSSCHNRAYSRLKYQMFNLISGGNFLNEIDSRNFNQYDQPRHVYLDSSRMGNQFCQSRLGRLGRNCFSSENIAYASTKRSAYPMGYNCSCPYCRHMDSRYVCHHCQSLHNRLRYQDAANAARQYIYQLSRNCRCPFCRGDYANAKLLAGANRSPGESSSRGKESHYRNSSGCVCRNKTMPSSSSTMQVGRYVDWINRVGSSVNNPLYATIHIGRIDRSCPGSSNTGNPASNADAPGTNTASTSSAGSTEPGTSSNLRSIFASTSYNASTSAGASVCPANRSAERQHTCDDSCIRNQNVAGICQFLGRCERAECNHGRLSVHWWFVNRWFNPERNVDNAPVEEEPRERQESDSDDS